MTNHIQWLYIDLLNGHKIFRHDKILYCRSKEGYVYPIVDGKYGRWIQSITNV